MPRKFRKYKLLLDENFPLRQRFLLLNSRYNVKHIKGDYKQIGLIDEAVYERAKKERRLIVTFNDKDFREIAARSKNTGVIGVSTNLAPDQIDKKLTAFLRKAKPKDLFGKFKYIHGEPDQS